MRLHRMLGAIRHPYTEYQVRKAKNKHRQHYPDCAICGLTRSFYLKRKNDVHHKKPVHLFPELATDPKNLITLCRFHHWLVGHLKNWRKYNDAIDCTVHMLCAVYFECVEKIRRLK